MYADKITDQVQMLVITADIHAAQIVTTIRSSERMKRSRALS